MATIRARLTGPAARAAGFAAVTVAVYAVLVALTGSSGASIGLGALALTGSLLLGSSLPPRPAPNPVRRRATPRHARRRGGGAPTPVQGRWRGGRAHKPAPGVRCGAPGAAEQPAADFPSFPGTRSAAGSDLDRTQRLPVYRHGRVRIPEEVR